MIKFLEVNESYKTDCSDGTKCCFLFSAYHKVDEFVAELKKRIKTDVTKDSYIGYKTIYVPVEKYEKAVLEGLNIILNDKSYETAGAYWVNYYGERSCYVDEEILYMTLAKKYLNDKGDWSKFAKLRVTVWKEKLEKLLNTDIDFVQRCGNVKFFIKRTTRLEHDTILSKIRKSNIIENSPFEGYALINYFGEFVKK